MYPPDKPVPLAVQQHAPYVAADGPHTDTHLDVQRAIGLGVDDVVVTLELGAPVPAAPSATYRDRCPSRGAGPARSQELQRRTYDYQDDTVGPMSKSNYDNGTALKAQMPHHVTMNRPMKNTRLPTNGCCVIHWTKQPMIWQMLEKVARPDVLILL